MHCFENCKKAEYMANNLIVKDGHIFNNKY